MRFTCLNLSADMEIVVDSDGLDSNGCKFKTGVSCGVIYHESFVSNYRTP